LHDESKRKIKNKKAKKDRIDQLQPYGHLLCIAYGSIIKLIFTFHQRKNRIYQTQVGKWSNYHPSFRRSSKILWWFRCFIYIYYLVCLCFSNPKVAFCKIKEK